MKKCIYKKINVLTVLILAIVGVVACSSDKKLNNAKLSAAKYYTDKAAPGKAYDVQVTEAVKTDDGKYRVKSLVDGQARVGIYNPDTENFDEGYYTLAYERGKKIAELEEEVRYLKEQVAKKDKENFQLKLRMKYLRAGKVDAVKKVHPAAADDAADDEAAESKAPSEKNED